MLCLQGRRHLGIGLLEVKEVRLRPLLAIVKRTATKNGRDLVACTLADRSVRLKSRVPEVTSGILNECQTLRRADEVQCLQ